jgi:O-antigen/teichoic acid export membrane protein
VSTKLSKISTQVALQGLAIVLNLALVIVIAKYCGPQVRGAMSVYNTTMYFATLIGCFGLGSAFTYFVASKKVSASACHSLAVLITMYVGFFAYIFLGGLTGFENSKYLLGTSNFRLPLIFAIQLCCIVYTTLVSAIFVGKQHPSVGIIAQVAQLFLFTFFLGRSFDIMGSSVEMQTTSILRNMMFAYGSVSIVLFLLASFKLGFGPPHKLFKQNLAPYAGIVLLGNIIQTLCYRADVLFLQWAHKPMADIGVYSIAALFAQMLWLLAGQVANAQYGLVSANKNISSSSIVGIAKCLLWYSVVVFVFGLAAAYFVVPHLFGKAFSASVPLALILMPGVVLICGSVSVSIFNAGTNQVRYNVYGSLLGLAVCIVGYLLFIPRYGVWAAAVVSSVAYAVTTLYYYWVFCRQQGVKILDFFKLQGIALKDFGGYWRMLQHKQV